MDGGFDSRRSPFAFVLVGSPNRRGTGLETRRMLVRCKAVAPEPSPVPTRTAALVTWPTGTTRKTSAAARSALAHGRAMVPCSAGDAPTTSRRTHVILLAEAVSGDTPVTLALVVLVIGAVAAYVGEKVSTSYRLSALERADEKQQDATGKCEGRLSSLETRATHLEARDRPRSGVYPTLGVDDR
jgi:hypothetical protein